MADKPALPSLAEGATKPAEDTPKTSAGDTSEGAKNGAGEEVSDPRRDIFDKRFAAIMEVFGEACERHGVDVALAIAMHPDDEHPMVFLRGHHFDAAALGAKVVRHIQNKLMRELSGEDYDEEEDA